MATSFTSLPIVDLASLSDPSFSPNAPQARELAGQLYNVFATSGFAYLTNLPLSFTHQEVFGLSKEFFGLPEAEKWKMAKKTFAKENENTYRGYFPTQPLQALDNLKEGFEIGSGRTKSMPTPANIPRFTSTVSTFNLYEPNVWPSPSAQFPSSSRRRLTQLYAELQALSSQLLSLLAISLGKQPDHFAPWLTDSLSTLRLLHYPAVGRANDNDDAASLSSADTLSSAATTAPSETSSVFSSSEAATDTTRQGPGAMTEPQNCNDAAAEAAAEIKLSCTPHTDSGILTLLHQDPTGGLEVRNGAGDWIPAPYVPGSVVVNIGDLMARVSGGRFVATMHRVRAPRGAKGHSGWDGGFGRFSVPFFFEPGEDCVVTEIRESGVEGEGVRYGVHVREKMSTFVEFQSEEDGDAGE